MSKATAAVFWFLLPCWAFLPLFAAVRLAAGQPAPAAVDWAVILGCAALAAAGRSEPLIRADLR